MRCVGATSTSRQVPRSERGMAAKTTHAKPRAITLIFATSRASGRFSALSACCCSCAAGKQRLLAGCATASRWGMTNV